MRNVFTASRLSTLLCALLTLTAPESHANPRPCRFGYKGVYVTWDKSSSFNGTGVFETASGRGAVLPNFTWDVTGKPLSVRVGTDEPFQGGNSMKGFYGQADDATNLNIRIEANNTPARQPIPHSAILTLDFNGNTPASGWGFAVIDIDVDQIRMTAKDVNGNQVSSSTIAKWFVQDFDANPSVNGVNIPKWDPQSAAVIGSESASKTWRTTVEGGLTDTEAASAWFQPTMSLSELSFEYQSLQNEATPSYHILLAACESPFIAPTPTPIPVSGDSDGDTIPDSTEGTNDPDNDNRPNYLDKDSDGDSVPDSQEGQGDTDGDGNPDYLDQDSDNDNVPDRIEVDPDAPDSTPGDEDNNQDGVDDKDSSRNVTPSDEDTDGTSDFRDPDSDNDTIPDGNEAYDLDGDGSPDITPSGEDDNENGLDDAYDGIISTDQINKNYIGENSPPPCTSTDQSTTKASVRKAMNALALRVPGFDRRAVACGGARSTNLINKTAVARKSFERTLQTKFANETLVCPTNACPRVSKSADKARLFSLANELARYAKQSKLNAMKVCKPQEHGGTDPRPKTPEYLASLRKAIAALPRTVNECN